MPRESLKRAWLVSFEDHDRGKLFVVMDVATILQAATVPKCQTKCNLTLGGITVKEVWCFVREQPWN
ncbi:MAG: hypothetical protein CAF45_011725 [Nitrospira sp. CG24E]|nr:MAG: hypothetical protein CAF45_011725 [Nitrospira sp. CG24E]